MSDSTILALNTLVSTLQTQGIWDLLYDVWPCCGSNLSAALVKLKVAPGTATAYTNNNFAGGDYNETGGSGGLNANGTTQYLSGGVQLVTLGLNCSLFASARSLVAGAGNRALCGAITGSDQYWVGGLAPASASDGRLGQTTTASLASALAAARWCITRLANNDLQLYKDSAPVGSSNTVTTGSSSTNGIFVFAFNSSGSPSAWLQCRLTGHCSGKGLTGTQVGQLTAAWAAFDTALSR